jgi:hypothetical protein
MLTAITILSVGMTWKIPFYIALLLFIPYLSFKIHGVSYPLWNLFSKSRGALVGNVTTALILMVVFVRAYSKMTHMYRVLLPMLLVTTLSVGIFFYTPFFKIQSMLDLNRIVDDYFEKLKKTENAELSEQLPGGLTQPKLYEKNIQVEEFEIRTGGGEQIHTEEALDPKTKSVTWRLLVWTDMMEELIRDRLLFGANFGVPFRSKRVEKLQWEHGVRTGWLDPHNSFIHILYRSGLVGLISIVVLAAMIVRLTRDAIRSRRFDCILLLGILYYWPIVSFFEVILELPYFAIPFWGLFGFIAAHIETHSKQASPAGTKQKQHASM